MSAWKELVKMALLGTDKARLQENLLPEALRPVLSHADPADPEAYFYKAAALTYMYEKAGKLPADTPIPSLGQAEEETKPEIPAALRVLMPELLREESRHPELLAWVFEKIAQKCWVLPPEFLVQVLQLATLAPFKRLRMPLREVVGARGLWLQQFNPAWKYLALTNPEQIWQEGTNAERRQLLSDLRNTDPVQALQWFKEAMETETNARERKELIRIFQAQPNAAETAFLEILYEQLPPPKETGKAAQIEIRRLLSEILLSSPHSTLFQDITRQLKAYAVTQKQMLGLRNKITLQIPQKEDNLLNSKQMCDQFCFDNVSPLPGVSDPEFWFCELLRCLHPSAWEQVFQDMSWADILALLQKTEPIQKKVNLPLLHQLAQALARTRYRKAVQAYTREFGVDESNYFMLNALQADELEKFILNKSQGVIPPYLREVLAQQPEPWSKPFSRFMLKCFTTAVPGGYHNQEFAKILSLCMHFDPVVLDELFEISRMENREWQQQVIRSQLVMPLIRLLELRQTIQHILNKH
ncbi:MAG: DUF5691 domain-containing protein [Bacteroidota bacterium]